MLNGTKPAIRIHTINQKHKINSIYRYVRVLIPTATSILDHQKNKSRRKTSPPSSRTKTSPCSKGDMVPASVFKYGSAVKNWQHLN